MTPEEKKELRHVALLIAFDKMRALSNIKAHLRAAARECRSWQERHNTFADDPEIEKLRKIIEELSWNIGDYGGKVVFATTGVESDAYEYTDGNDVYALRRKEAEARGVKFDPDDEDWEANLPTDDPFDLYLRLKETS